MKYLLPFTAALLVLAACGDPVALDRAPATAATTGASTTVPEAAPGTTDPLEPPSGELDFVASQRDLADARAELDAARERWASAGIDSYAIEVAQWCECDGWVIESVVLRGQDLGSRLVRSPENPTGDARPSSVDDLFARSEQLLSQLEAEPSSAAAVECDGLYLDLAFDPDNGVPTLSSDNTPCDGGAAWATTLTEIDPDGDAPAVDVDEFTGVSLNSLSDPGQLTFPSHDGLVVVYAEGFDGDESRTRSTIGEPCAFAVDQAQCNAAVDDLLSDPIGSALVQLGQCGMCVPVHLAIVATSGSDIELVTQETLTSVIGPIDTPTEALLAQGTSGWARPIDDGGFETVTSQMIADCDPIVDRFSLSNVDDRGRSHEIDKWFTVEWGVCV